MIKNNPLLILDPKSTNKQDPYVRLFELAPKDTDVFLIGENHTNLFHRSLTQLNMPDFSGNNYDFSTEQPDTMQLSHELLAKERVKYKIHFNPENFKTPEYIFFHTGAPEYDPRKHTVYNDFAFRNSVSLYKIRHTAQSLGMSFIAANTPKNADNPNAATVGISQEQIAEENIYMAGKIASHVKKSGRHIEHMTGSMHLFQLSRDCPSTQQVLQEQYGLKTFSVAFMSDAKELFPTEHLGRSYALLDFNAAKETAEDFLAYSRDLVGQNTILQRTFNHKTSNGVELPNAFVIFSDQSCDIMDYMNERTNIKTDPVVEYDMLKHINTDFGVEAHKHNKLQRRKI